MTTTPQTEAIRLADLLRYNAKTVSQRLVTKSER